MNRRWFIVIVNICILAIIILRTGSCFSQNRQGPLRVSPKNPRYFTDNSGRAIFLTGSNTWANLVDISLDDPPKKFDYPKYLDWMQQYNHNFFRLWAWELVKGLAENKWWTASPHPWERTGEGKANDGKPKFDLTRLNSAYFERLQARVQMAQERGMYLSVMLFEGWELQFSPNPWQYHPFNPGNNINGVNGDLDGDGNGLEIYTLTDAKITLIQEEYVKKVVDTANDFDNILFEISNENPPPSTKWQYHMIDFIHEYEKSKSKQHPVGMTFQFQGGSNKTLFDSPAEWISPNPEGGYKDDPPAAEGKKVIINDTDHLWGIGGNQAWVWKTFTRGMYPIFMDLYDSFGRSKPDPQWDPIRKNLGYVRRLAERTNLIDMIPHNELASSSYCLANPGKEYIVYLPLGGEVTVNLKDVSGSFLVEWFNPNTNESKMGEKIEGGGDQILMSPFGGAGIIQSGIIYILSVFGISESYFQSADAVLYIKAI